MAQERQQTIADQVGRRLVPCLQKKVGVRQKLIFRQSVSCFIDAGENGQEIGAVVDVSFGKFRTKVRFDVGTEL